jgi:hypothetical protein
MQFKYFNITTKSSGIPGTENVKYPIASVTNGNVDVTNGMVWSLGGDTSEVPSLVLTEYKLLYGRRLQSILNIVTNTAAVFDNNTPDPYASLYPVETTGFRYVLPYLVPSGGSLRGQVLNTWQDESGDKASDSWAEGTFKSLFPKLFDLAKTGLSVGSEFIANDLNTETAKRYSGTASRTIRVSFPLYNTLDWSTNLAHFSFVNLFTFQNTKTRTSWLTTMFPKLYKIECSAMGGPYMPIAYVSDLNIQSIGTTRHIQSGEGKYLMPEAYKVNISFTEMVTQSSNIVEGEIGGSKVQVMYNGATGDKVTAAGSIRSQTSIIA